MRCLLLLVAASAIVSMHTGHCAPETIYAFVGDPVILPCQIKFDDVLPTVEWFKLPNIIAMMYRGCETFGEKNESYRDRTNLFLHELKNGNISLKIWDVKLSDAGTYNCTTRQGKDVMVRSTVELRVGAVSEPKLSVSPTVDGAVTVQCHTNWWFPEPEITFLDHQEKDITPGSTKPETVQDPQGCYNVTRTMTLPPDTNRVVCRVTLNSQFNQMKSTEISIPAGCQLITYQIATAVTVILCILIGIGIGIGIGIWIEKCRQRTRSEKERLPLYETPRSRSESCASNYSGSPVLSPRPQSPKGPSPNAGTVMPSQGKHPTKTGPSRADVPKSPTPSPQPAPQTSDPKPAPPTESSRSKTSDPKPAAPTESSRSITSDPKPAAPTESSRSKTSDPKPAAPTESSRSKTSDPKPAPPTESSRSITSDPKPAAPTESSRSKTSDLKPATATESSRSKSGNTPQSKAWEAAVPKGNPATGHPNLRSGNSRPEQSPVKRTSSLHIPRPSRNNNVPRRASSNRFSILEGLREDSEPLL